MLAELMSTPPIELESVASSGESLGAVVAAGGGYAVKLPIFEGPLDLLLHLIRQNDVEIRDISIAQISRQYLDYLGRRYFQAQCRIQARHDDVTAQPLV